MIEVKSFQDSLAEQWDEFVENQSRNGTFLHTRKFFCHNPVNQELDDSLIFFKNSHIIGVAPAVLRNMDGRNIWNSHALSTYGGYVVSDKLGVEEALEIVDLTIQHAREKNLDELIIRNPFRIYNAMPTDETDYAMWVKGFQILRRDVEIAIFLDGYTEQTIYSLYNSTTRSAVRKAEKTDTTVEMTEDYEAYWRILAQNLAERHTAKPTHSLEEFIILRNLVGDEKIKLFGAYHNQILIAGIILFIANKQTVHAQYIAGLQEFQTLRPINLLIHRICVWAITNGFKYFNLGMPTYPEGGVNAGLCRFKEGFGGRSVLRETMHLVLN